MVTPRSLRAEKRTAAKALGGSVLTNKVRFSTLVTSEQQATPVMRELVYYKNRLQHQVVNLQDLNINQAATIKELTVDNENYKSINTQGIQENKDIRATNKRLSDANLVLLEEQADQDAQLILAREQIVKYKNLLQAVDPQYSETHKKDEDIATLKSVIQNLTCDNDEFDKQNSLLRKMYEDSINEQKKLFLALNTAGQVLAAATRAQRIAMV